MAENYKVNQGDCISSIAFDKGFFPDTIWNHPNNAELKSRRKNPNVLHPGDVVFVPDKRLKEESEPTNQVHKFRMRNTPAQLRIQIMVFDKPIANRPFTLTVDGRVVSKPGDLTDSRGFALCPIPPSADKGTLTVIDGDDTYVYSLQLGHLNPVDDLLGVKQRLRNMGYYDGPIDQNMTDETVEGLTDFQTDAGLPPNGALDQSTRTKLQQMHDLA